MVSSKLSFLFVVFMFFTVHTKAAQEAFVIADDDDFAPFCWLDTKENKVRGISHEIITEAFKIMKKPLVYKAQPWGRVTGTIQNKEYKGVDATVTIYTEARKEFLVASKNPIIITSYNLFTRPNHPQFEKMKSIKTIADLKSYKLVDYLGDGWAESRFKKEDGYNIEYAPKLTNTLKVLATEDRGADIFVQSEAIAKYNIKSAGLQDKIVMVPGVSLGNETFSLLVHKRSPRISWLKDFDAAMETMKKNGQIKAIYKKWLE